MKLIDRDKLKRYLDYLIQKEKEFANKCDTYPYSEFQRQRKYCFEANALAYELCENVMDYYLVSDTQPVNQWISVEDRLPESEKEVLVWYRYTWDAGFTSYGFGINVWYSNAKQWRDGCLLKGVEVLYWQPLPEPPKDGDVE